MFTTRVLVSFVLSAFFLALLAGCAGIPKAPRLSREDVVKLTVEGTSPETLRMAASSNGLSFPMSADNMLWLAERGLDDEHMQALLSAAGEYQTAHARRPGRDAVSVGYDLAGWLGPSAATGNLTMPPRTIINDAVNLGTRR